MATTSPDNIWTPDAGDDYALTVDLAATADSVQDAITANNNSLRGLNADRPANGSPGLFEGMTWFSTDTDILWLYSGTAWVAVDSPWTAFTPTWTASGGGASVGNGSLIGRWRYTGRGTIAVRYALTFGSTTSGGSGEWLFTLPSGIAAHSAGEQVMPCRVSLSGPGWAFGGVAVVTPSATTVAPFLSESITSTVLKHARNANSAGAPGTGVPIVGSGYSYSTGSTLTVEGILETA